MNNFESLIMKRYSDTEFARAYFEGSKKGLKPFEEKLVNTYLSNSHKILVVGCGAGRETVALAKNGYTVTAIDIVPEMVKQTKKMCQEKKVTSNVLVMDASKLDFRKQTFDAVLFLNCIIDQIPNSQKRKKAITEAYRVLKSDGVCIVISNNAFYPGKHFVYWKEHLRHIFSYLKARTSDFFDRVYAEKLPVFVHLSTPFYLRKLFKNFKILVFSSDRCVIEPAKKIQVPYFDALLILVAKKVKQ